MTSDANAPAYRADMDDAATEDQTGAIQDLFDEIGFNAKVTATFTGKSGVELVWVL